MAEVEALTYFDGTMDFEEPPAKRQCLDQTNFYTPSSLELSGSDFSQLDQFFDTQGRLNQDELEGAWTLSSLQTQNNSFMFSGFDAANLNLLSHQDQMFSITNNLFANDPSYGNENLELDADRSFPQNILNSASNAAIGSVDEVFEQEQPIVTQLCFGMVLVKYSSAI